MSEISFSQAQAGMREGYASGAPGVLVSGIVWLAAGLVAVTLSHQAAVYALLIGGAFIFPLSIVATKALGRRGSHTVGNPLGRLAAEGTIWLLAAIAVAYGMQLVRLEWFLPAMLLFIGGRYFTFQTIYGLRLFRALGAVLCALGLGLAVARGAPPVAAFASGFTELVFAVALFQQATQRDWNPACMRPKDTSRCSSSKAPGDS